MDLKNAKVLITGGSLGIGYETAKLFVNSGAKVAICGRDVTRLNSAARKIGALPILADVGKEEDVISMVEEVIDKFEGFNVLINNAAYGYFSAVQNIDTEQFNKMMAINLTGAMLCTREASKNFIANNYGNIISISSTAGQRGFANGTPYCASKFALVGMNECWRADLRKYNIRVMLVYPSEVQTDFSVNAGGKKRDFNPTKLLGEDIAHTIKSMLEIDDRGFITEAAVWATNPQ